MPMKSFAQPKRPNINFIGDPTSVTTPQDDSLDRVIGKAQNPSSNPRTRNRTSSSKQKLPKKSSQKGARAPTNQMNNIYLDGDQSIHHRQHQKVVDKNGPWVEVTGGDIVEREAKLAKNKASSSSSRAHGTKRAREADDSEGGTAASGSSRVKRAKASVEEAKRGDSTISGHEGRIFDGSRTLQEQQTSETIGISAFGEGPSTATSQTFSLGPHEE